MRRRQSACNAGGEEQCIARAYFMISSRQLCFSLDNPPRRDQAMQRTKPLSALILRDASLRDALRGGGIGLATDRF
jgi:hypothetical protein